MPVRLVSLKLDHRLFCEAGLIGAARCCRVPDRPGARGRTHLLLPASKAPRLNHAASDRLRTRTIGTPTALFGAPLLERFSVLEVWTAFFVRLDVGHRSNNLAGEVARHTAPAPIRISPPGLGELIFQKYGTSCVPSWRPSRPALARRNLQSWPQRSGVYFVP
jgi:hypothetical protein